MNFSIHVGAHKTATTHFQDTLSLNQRKSDWGGAVYIDRETFRQSQFLKKVADAHVERAFNIFNRTTLADILRSSGFVAERYLISEEDILGLSRNLLEGLYPDRVNRLAAWREVLSGARLELFLSIRDYKDVLPSAYSQSLRQGDVLAPFERYRNFWMRYSPSWVDLAKSMIALFPDVPITVWSFERYTRNPTEIAEQFCGCRISETVRSAPEDTRRLSQKAIDRIQKLDISLPQEARRREIESILATADGGAFSPLNIEEQRVLSDRYKRDLAILSSMRIKTLF